ncbi:PAS domain S-box protein [Clostridium tarantellae]|uniref:histidine kinase n=2 Tax=Clostridium tarantellae TaxID=39493 RepID=A0A6I1MQC7_9CLOT|nr:PAS domain S-box protein [Clostridium tarantellae]
MLICATKKNSKLKQIIVANKTKSVISVILFSLLEISLDSLGFLNELKNNNFLLSIHLIIIIIGYFIFNVLWIKKSLKNKELAYIFISSSIMFLSIKRIYIIIDKIFLKKYFISSYEEILILLTILSVVLLILGILFEMIKKVHKSNILEEELTVFYNLMEFNYHNSIVLYDCNKKLIYANEKLREKYCENKTVGKKEQYKELENYMEKIINEFNVISILDIINEIEKYNGWKTTLNIKGRFIRVECQKLRVKSNKYYYAASLCDVTDDYAIHKKIDKSKPIVQNITENIQDLIIVTDNNYKITYVNNAVTKTLEYSEEELICKSIEKIMLEQYVDKVMTSEGSRVECGLIKKESTEFLPVECINSEILGENNSVLGKILVFRDLTISNEINTLTKRYKEVKAYEEARNEFFANLSHEFRTPLNIFYSTIQLLDLKCEKNSKEFSNEYKKYRTSLKHNCYRMLRLISNIIDVTKINSGALKGEFVNYNIVDLIENVTMSIIPYAKVKNLTVVFDTLEEEIYIKCDLDKIERAILNMLSNAIKFTKPGGNILVKVSKDNEWVYVNIKDTGVGIPFEMQQFIFDRFVQADKSLNRHNEGSGIGLCVVKSIIEIHGGEIRLKSDGENGSEFIIKIPNDKLDNLATNKFEHNIDNEKVELELSDIYELY